MKWRSVILLTAFLLEFLVPVISRFGRRRSADRCRFDLRRANGLDGLLRHLIAPASAAILVAGFAAPAATQSASQPEVRWGVAVSFNEPLGEFSASVEQFKGISLNVRRRPAESRYGGRVDVEFLGYDTHYIVIGGLGAEWVPLAGLVRPYLTGLAGAARFDSWSFLSRTGVGVTVDVTQQIALDIAAFGHASGSATYRVGSDTRTGSIRFWSFRMGMAALGR